MGLARYFDKSLLAGSAVLEGFDPSAFTRLLEEHVVAVCWDAQAASSAEGQTLLELTVELVARLYPALALDPVGDAADGAAPALASLAREINQEISLVDPALATVCLCIGSGADASAAGAAKFYLGSDGWIARFSSRGPVPVGGSANPFGAAAAACFGAANVFRHVFRAHLEAGDPDAEIRLSMLSLDPTEVEPANPVVGQVEIGEAFLVGVGAIGSAAAWALARVPGLSGTLHLIDNEPLDDTNLQRYTGTREREVTRDKVDIAKARFAVPRLRVVEHSMTWGSFLQKRGDWRLERVLIALDSALDRIHVQGALPRWIANAWTQATDIGVSRHGFDDASACVACLYLPEGVQLSEDEIISSALRLEGREALMMVRNLLYTNDPVGEDFVRQAAQAMGAPEDELLRFADRPLRRFYQETVCSGVVLRLGGYAEAPRAEIPLAFQSAMAGVLLAVELVAHAASLRQLPVPTTTRMNLLRPLGQVLGVPEAKRGDGSCICQDPDYISRYREKYTAADAGVSALNRGEIAA